MAIADKKAPFMWRYKGLDSFFFKLCSIDSFSLIETISSSFMCKTKALLFATQFSESEIATFPSADFLDLTLDLWSAG